MKAYIITSGTIFAAITVAHIMRMVAEGRHVSTEPLYIILTLLSAGLTIWAAWLVLRKL